MSETNRTDALSCANIFPTWEEATSGIDDSRFVGHAKIAALETNCTRAGARIMYDRLWGLLHHRFDRTPSPAFVAMEAALRELEPLLDAAHSDKCSGTDCKGCIFDTHGECVIDAARAALRLAERERGEA